MFAYLFIDIDAQNTNIYHMLCIIYFLSITSSFIVWCNATTYIA